MLFALPVAHRRYRRYLDAHVDGELSGRLAERVRVHVDRCAMCTHAAATTLLVKQRLRRFGMLPPPHGRSRV